jgi:hypothetical protein
MYYCYFTQNNSHPNGRKWKLMIFSFETNTFLESVMKVPNVPEPDMTVFSRPAG